MVAVAINQSLLTISDHGEASALTDGKAKATATGPLSRDSSLSTRVLREPTTHFLLIAVLAFLIYGLSEGRQGKLLEIDAREIEARIFLQEMSSGRALSEAQRSAVIDAYIDEQILVREALALDLDNDARIHDMLAQKMRHVLSADIIQPSETELRDYYEANLARYRRPATVTADELVFNQQRPLPQEVLDALATGAGAETLLSLAAGSNAPLNNASRLDLSNIFSEAFAERVFSASADTWIGPFTSNRGQHWLRVAQRNAATVPELESIIDRVRLDWITDEEEARLDAAVADLRSEYRVSIEGGEDSED